MYKDLSHFLETLDRKGELARIGDPVSPDLEIAAVIDRVSKSPGGGPALLFERPTGFDVPVAANVFGSMSRMCLALGVSSLDEIAREIEELLTPRVPAGLLDAMKLLPVVGRLRDLMPRTVKDAPCQEVVGREASLDELLSGKRERLDALRDARGRMLLAGRWEPEPGTAVTLNIKTRDILSLCNCHDH